MSRMLKNATVEELNQLLDTLWETPDISVSQAALISDIVEELTERGECERRNAEETRAALEESRRAIAALEKDTLRGSNPEVWLPKALVDAKQDRLRQKRRVTQAVAASIAVVFLINTITLSASGLNILGEIFRWTGQAVYTIFGGKIAEEIVLVHGEMQALQNKLDELGIQVSLPEAIPEGYSFSNLEFAVLEEPCILIAWFSQLGSVGEFSLRIDGSYADGLGTKTETNTQEELEPIAHNGRSYSVFNNNSKIKVVWIDNGFEVILQGDLSYEEAEAVIQSIEK